MNLRSVLAALCFLSAISHAADSADEDRPGSPIRVGILHSQTGTMASSEASLVDAAKMAVKEINERGGVLGRPLEAVVEDGASDWPTFALKAEKLIVEDKVVSLFGCWTSASRKAVIPVLTKHNRLLWYPVQYEGQENHPNIIYTGAVPNQQIIPAVDWARRKFGPKMFLVGSDYIFPQTASEIIKRRLVDLDATPVGEEYQPIGSQDFGAIIAKIREAQPDVVLNTLNGDSNRAFFQAFDAAGLNQEKARILSFSIAEVELRSIGVDLTVDHYCSWNYFQSIDTPDNQRFVRKFRELYGADRVTDDPIEAAYFQMHLFAKAAEQAGSTDSEAIRTAAKGLIFPAPGGLIRIDPANLHAWKVARIGRIQKDGQFRVIWNSEDPIAPRPFLRETFLLVAADQGRIMFESISAMIAMEADEAADSDRKDVLVAMAEVRGYLGEARRQFRNAIQNVHPRNRAEFDESWRNFEQRYVDLTKRKGELTNRQMEALKEFEDATGAFAANAASMFEALYPAGDGSDEVTP